MLIDIKHWQTNLRGIQLIMIMSFFLIELRRIKKFFWEELQNRIVLFGEDLFDVAKVFFVWWIFNFLFDWLIDSGTDGVANNYQVKQLEQQNERLKEAIVKSVFSEIPVLIGKFQF